MSYKARLKYTAHGHRKKELLAHLRRSLKRSFSECDGLSYFTKQEQNRYIHTFLKKLNHFSLRDIHGFLQKAGIAFLISAFASFCTGTGESRSLIDETPFRPLDIVIANEGVNRVYENDDDNIGTLTGDNLSTATSSSQGIALGDIDGDNDLDIVVANDGQANIVYLNDGSGSFPPIGANLSAATNDSRGIALGDIDGDNDLDIVVANDGANRVYLNDGSGSFTGRDLSTDMNNSRSIALGDIDGDNDLDIVVANFGATRVYENDGRGSFTGRDLDSTATNNSQGIALGDLDGDGDLDVVVANFIQEDIVHLNDGRGSFTGRPLSTETGTSQGIALGDLDGDGDLDLVVAIGGDYGYENRVYTNDGRGSFAGSDLEMGVERPSNSVALGDLDGDGDLDIVLANEVNLGMGADPVNRVYLNDGNVPPVFTGSDLSGIATARDSIGIALGDLGFNR